MIINIIFIFTILILFYLSGYFFLKMVIPQMGLIELSSTGFVIGVGLSTYIIFLLGLVGVGFTLFNVILTLFCINLILYLICKLVFKRSLHIDLVVSFRKIRKLSKFERVIIIGIIYFLFSSLISNLYWPVWIWDAVQLYDYRAKLIAVSGSVFYPAESFYEIFYPLMTSVLHAIFYLTDYSINPKFIYSIFFICMVFGVYSFTRRITNRKIALLTSFVISFYPLFFKHSQYALTNIIYSTYIILASFYLIIRIVEKDERYMIASAFLFSFTSFVRNEPIWIYVTVLLIVLSLYKKLKKSEVLIFILINYFIGSGHVFFKSKYQDLLINNSLTQFSFVGKLLEFIDNFQMVYFIDATLQVYQSVIKEMQIPLVALVFILIYKKFKVSSHVKYLVIFLFFYLLMFWFGSLFYRIISSTEEFFALTGSLKRYSVFWKTILLVNLFVFIKDIYTLFYERNE